MLVMESGSSSNEMVGFFFFSPGCVFCNFFFHVPGVNFLIFLMCVIFFSSLIYEMMLSKHEAVIAQPFFF